LNKTFEESLAHLVSYCQKSDYKGWDPFDGLNSLAFQNFFTFKSSKYLKIFWIQFTKHSPINLRIITQIPKEYNPKALGLFISGYCNLFKVYGNEFYLSEAKRLAEIVISLSAKNFSNYSWGYNFPWQARYFYQPSYSPTVVATSFIANSLLDIYSITKTKRYLDIARSSCDFVLYDLQKTYEHDGTLIFSYSPFDKTRVFNASLLGACLLSRVYSLTKEDILIKFAKNAVSFCCNNQRIDGSWTYGLEKNQQWIDSFHTGYNLSCIADYQNFSCDKSFHENLSKGLKFYVSAFFKQDGTPRYYYNRTYPIDIHSVAQLPITLSKTRNFSEYKYLIDNVLKFSINKMQDSSGFFYYQKFPFFVNKISYIRWSQAWMFYGLSVYLRNTKEL